MMISLVNDILIYKLLTNGHSIKLNKCMNISLQRLFVSIYTQKFDYLDPI